MLSEEKLLARLEPPVGRKVRMVLDTDTFNEEDDQFALAYSALAHMRGRITLEAVYAAPFTRPDITDPAEGMELSFGEIHHILSLLGMDDGRFPVLRGATRYLGGAGPDWCPDWQAIVRGEPQRIPPATAPPEPADSPAVRDLIARALASPDDDPLYVCAIGCATNVASALLAEPRIAEKIVVIFLGGCDLSWKDCVEYNLRQDVPAGRVLLSCGVPLVLIPTNKTSRLLCTSVWELEHFLGASPVGRYLTGLVAGKLRASAPALPDGAEYAASKIIWDIAAPAALLHPEYMDSVLAAAPTVTDDLRWAPGPDPHPIRVIDFIRRDAVFTDFFGEMKNA